MSLRDQVPRYLLDRSQISSTVSYTALFSLVFILLSIPYSGNTWFTLDGRRLDGKPTAKGLYIHGGRKVIVQ